MDNTIMVIGDNVEVRVLEYDINSTTKLQELITKGYTPISIKSVPNRAGETDVTLALINLRDDITN